MRRGYSIEPCELARVFPVRPDTPETSAATAPVVHHATDPATDLVAELRAVIADLRQDRDKLHAALEREQANHAATQSRLLPAPVAARWRWWRRA